MNAVTIAILRMAALSIVGGTALGQSASTTYYLGEVRMSLPSGQPAGTSVSLVKRTLLPADNRVVEVVATIDAAKPVREYTTVFDVTGARFRMKDEEGTFTGEGEFSGSPWEWTGWKYDVVMSGQKGRLQGDDVITPAGLSVRKSFSTTDGVVRMLFAEDLKPVSKAVYEVLRLRLLPDRK